MPKPVQKSSTNPALVIAAVLGVGAIALFAVMLLAGIVFLRASGKREIAKNLPPPEAPAPVPPTVPLPPTRIEQQPTAPALPPPRSSPPVGSVATPRPVSQSAPTTPSSSAVPSSPTPVKEDDRAKVRGYLDALASKTLNQSATHTKLAEISFVTPIPDMRDEVSQALDPFLISKDLVCRSYSMNGVKKWGTKHNLPTLLKLLESLDDSSRRQAMECLALYSDDPAHAQKIASLLLEPSDRYSAQQALKKMKPLAEDAVLPLLDNEDEQVLFAVCEVLRETGTEKSVAPLEKLSQNKASGSVRYLAESALRSIKRRSDKAK